MTVVLKGGELEFVGSYGLAVVRQLPLITLPWLDEGPVAVPVLMGRNGRPRQRITLPGHGAGVKPASAGKTYPPEPMSNEEALRLFAVIPQQHAQGAPNRAGIRDKALFSLLWRTGLRISEALDLRPHHVDIAARRVTVLHGKGDKRRTVGIDAGGLAALMPWLFERSMLGIDPTAPLFCTIQLPGRGGRLYPAYVRSKLHQYGRLAGIPKRVHPHGFRHAIAVSLVREGFSLPNIMVQLGHANVATTALYVRSMGADEAFDLVGERVWPGGAS